MTAQDEIVLDFARAERIGLEEAIFAAGKSVDQIDAITAAAIERQASGEGPPAMLLTRLDEAKHARLRHRDRLDYDAASRTAVLGTLPAVRGRGRVAVVCAGTSDVAAAREALRTLRYAGEEATLIADVGVAGLWRLTRRLEDIRAHPIVICAAGMDAALPSVLGGLVAGALIALPTSVGYGVAEGGRAALDAVLSSCSPGIAVVNIDNGYGAACAALRILRAADALARPDGARSTA